MIEYRGWLFPDEYKDYNGCNNCQYQSIPLTACYRPRSISSVYPMCRFWKKRKEVKRVDMRGAECYTK